MLYYPLMFGVSLGLTLVIEGLVGLCFGMRTREQLLLLVLVNVLTNPAAVWLCNGLGMPQIPIEILVVIIEYYVYHSFRKSHSLPHPLLLSLTANGVSWGLGIILQLL